MGRVEQRLYRQQMARRRLGRMIVLTLLIFAAGALGDKVMTLVDCSERT